MAPRNTPFYRGRVTLLNEMHRPFSSIWRVTCIRIPKERHVIALVLDLFETFNALVCASALSVAYLSLISLFTDHK